MATDGSKSQIDLLGRRLRDSALTEADIRLLDRYRRSFGNAYERVVSLIREQLSLEPTGRPAKSTHSIIEKLKRETIRLTQIQDIAGCRIVVDDLATQEAAVNSLCALFAECHVADRRGKPSHGYRAVHVIPKVAGMPVEIQVRTSLQHLWAELSEKLADLYDPTIKYGGGSLSVAKALSDLSVLIARLERLEGGLAKADAADPFTQEMEREIVSIRIDMKTHLEQAIAQPKDKLGLGQ